MGTHLVSDFLSDNVEIVNLDIEKPMISEHGKYWKKINLLNAKRVNEVFRQLKPTHVVHLAARTDLDEVDDLDGYAVNIEGVTNVLNAIVQTESVKRVIITSSMLVCRLGYQPSSDIDYAPINLYGESKVLTEKITRNTDPACVWTLIRPTTIWGPYHKRMEGEFFSTLRKGLYVHPGKKICLKSYGYVGNSIFQIRKLLEAAAPSIHGKTFYISDPPIDLRKWVGEFSFRLTTKQLRTAPFWTMYSVALIGDLFVRSGWKQFPLTTFRLKNMTTENVVDVRPIMSISGRLPYTVSQGVDETISWLERE